VEVWKWERKKEMGRKGDDKVEVKVRRNTSGMGSGTAKERGRRKGRWEARSGRKLEQK
jgi:hypothetical protein